MANASTSDAIDFAALRREREQRHGPFAGSTPPDNLQPADDGGDTDLHDPKPTVRPADDGGDTDLDDPQPKQDPQPVSRWLWQSGRESWTEYPSEQATALECS